MGDFILILVIVIILAGAGFKIYWNKKHNIQATACSSCPYSDSCAGKK